MAKKSDRIEPKKECPSCGLGVSEQAMICEFCGWDFEEEDEWILQIEKLERELMLEKQRYEPGTVNHMIESTLRSPVSEKTQATVPASETAAEEDESASPTVWPEETIEEPLPFPSSARDESPESIPTPAKRPKVRRVRSVKASPQPPAPADVEPEFVPDAIPSQVPASTPPGKAVRRVRSTSSVRKAPLAGGTESATAAGPTEQEPPVRKTRVVRRVKKR